MDNGLSAQPVRLLDLGRAGAAGEPGNNRQDGVMTRRAITQRDPIKLEAFTSKRIKDSRARASTRASATSIDRTGVESSAGRLVSMSVVHRGAYTPLLGALRLLQGGDLGAQPRAPRDDLVHLGALLREPRGELVQLGALLREPRSELVQSGAVPFVGFSCL